MSQNDFLALKHKLVVYCRQEISKRIESSQQAMNNAQQAANEEGKSSAGDKYETGRAMMQIERDKAASQLAESLKLMQIINQLDLTHVHTSVRIGCLVQTQSQQFFLAVGLGAVTMDDETYYVISTASPMGKALLGLKAGDSFNFQGKQYTIQQLA